MTENWATAFGYGISDQGRARSLNSGRVLVTYPALRGGYPSITLASTHETVLIGDMVLTGFVGARPDGLEVCHYDGDVANNFLTNLRWDTHAANGADMVRHGRAVGPGRTAREHCSEGHRLIAPNLLGLLCYSCAMAGCAVNDQRTRDRRGYADGVYARLGLSVW